MFRVLFFSFLFFLGYQLIKIVAFFFRLKKSFHSPVPQQRQESKQPQHPFSSGEIRDAKFEDIS